MTLAELEEIKGIPRETIRTRIKAGWTAEAAAETPQVKDQTAIDPKWHGKVLEVTFPHFIPKVFEQMQPIPNKRYVAYPHQSSSSRLCNRAFYTIILENSKPLIVYPGEFTILGEAAMPA